MAALGALPRALADDLLLITTGPGALSRFAQAFQATADHLQCMGGKIASTKSTLFSNRSKVRTWLSRKRWQVINSTVPVVNQFRDLGSTLAVAAAASTQQSRKRIQKATRTLHRVFALPQALPQKLIVLRATSISKALYSCETSHVDESALNSFFCSYI